MKRFLFKTFVFFLLFTLIFALALKYYVANRVGFNKIIEYQGLVKLNKKSSISLSASIYDEYQRKFNLSQDFLPFNGAAHKQTVFCREFGEFINYESDRYGFRNKDSHWDHSVDVVIVGDSFSQGACVSNDYTFTEQLMNKGKNTINLGSYSNGPLSNYAILKEYGSSLKPKEVFWFQVANDFAIDFNWEKQQAQLRRYLYEDSFTQSLIHKQRDIDHLSATILDKIIEENRKLKNNDISSLQKFDFFKKQLFQSLSRPHPKITHQNMDYFVQNQIDWPQLEAVFRKSKSLVENWGGRLTVVLIADAQMYDTRHKDSTNTYRQSVQEFFKQNSITFIDTFYALNKCPIAYHLTLPVASI
ncbi:MAG: hypothetical protein KBD78_17280 [Oligoflexales bacterium]|nr:hypothetical protein [Oligoflexales bacterium]